MLTLTRNIIKDIRSLEQRKARREQHAWLAEGNKMVGDLLTSRAFPCLRLLATQEWWDAHPHFAPLAQECYALSRAEMERVSLLPSPQDVLAVFSLPDDVSAPSSPLLHPLPSSPRGEGSGGGGLLLDAIQDPGNLGTIIRTADWFGVRQIYCTPGTADCYSPKVVQASMSALARVRLHYFDTREACCQWLQSLDCPIYGTFLDGDNIYRTSLTTPSLLVMGNEGRGVSPEVAQCVTHRLLIPDFSPDGLHVESLNVSIATAICLSQLCQSTL